jgi:hypothetical protein
MKFNTKDEAYNVLKNKHENNMQLTEEEASAVNEFFTQEELADMSFDHFKIEDCFNHDPTKVIDQAP